MRLIVPLLLALSIGLANAGGMTYFTINGAEIVLYGRCTPDHIRMCDCAIADETIAPELEDALFCWTVVGDTIIFENGKTRIERPVIDLQFRPRDEGVPELPFGDPAPTTLGGSSGSFPSGQG